MILFLMAASVAAQPDAATQSAAFQRAVAAVQSRVAAVDAVPNVIPARAIVMVHAGEEPVIDVRGVTRPDGGAAVTADTSFYIASMTKAFVGLMAIRLDELGIMPLDVSLGEAFPDMKVRGVDLDAVTMRRLLNHQVGFTAEALNIRTAYTDEVELADYPAIVALTQAPADASFQYSNLGYLLYAAALEKRTGRSWKGWLDEMVLEPLAMRHSSARSSDLTALTWGNERVGDKWRSLAPKRDSVMHAAGGMFVSSADMAKFLGAEAGARSSIGSATLARTRSGAVSLALKEGLMDCTGYSFGWLQCTAFGETVLGHTGGYTGVRTMMLVVPSRRVGFAAMFNSDSMTGGLSQQLAEVFLANLAGQAQAEPDPAAFAARYQKRAEDYRQNRTRREADARQEPRWGGWAWKPRPAELLGYAGQYRSAAYGDLDVSVGDDGLQARLNDTPLGLTPAVKDLFGAALASYSDLMPLKFERGPAGEIVAATLDDFRLERVPDR